jgi:hypothetical protein
MEACSDARITAAAAVRDLDLTPPAAPTAFHSVTLCVSSMPFTPSTLDTSR